MRKHWAILTLNLLAALSFIALVTTSRNRMRTTTLRLGHSLNTEHPVHVAMEALAREVHERSQGRLQIQLYPNSQLGSEREMIELTQLGAIDMVKTSTSPLEGFAPVMGVFSIPYVFRNEQHFWNVIEGPIGQNLLLSTTNQLLRGLCYYDAGSRSFYSKTKPILAPADLQGLKIRVQNSRTAIDMVKAMGGSPTPISFGELYTALDQGVVDGAENNPPSFLTSRHYEVCQHYTLDEHTRVPDILLIQTHAWNQLTPEHQQLLQSAANNSARFQRQLWKTKTAEALHTVQEAGVTIHTPDITSFQQAAAPLHQAYQDSPVGPLIQHIQAAP
ncbi:MAG: TRAP transporter substrate-binding protein [Limisphaerales bacterium]